MRNRKIQHFMKSVTAVGMCCWIAATGVCAEEAEVQTEVTTASETQTEGVTNAEMETGDAADSEAVKKVEAPVVLETLKVGDLEFANATEETAAALYIKKAAEDEWGENLLEEEANFTAETDVVYDLKLDDAKGDEQLFYNLALAEMEEICLVSEDEMTYVVYQDSAKDELVDLKAYALASFEEPQTVYSKVRLNVRMLPDTGFDIIETLSPGAEAQAYGEASGWYLIRIGEGYGYISGEYVTESKEEAEALAAQAKAEAEAAERARAEAAAAAAAQANAQKKDQPKKDKPKKDQPKKDQTEAPQTEAPQTEPPQTEAPQTERHEVSRENVPSCEDPDHGTTYITYSDGSVEVVEY